MKILSKIFNNQKYKLVGNTFIRVVSLSHDVWNYYNPENTIKFGDNNVIHHINRNPQDDRIENLQKLTRSEHTSLHNKLKMIGNRNTLGKKLTDKHKEKISNKLKDKIPKIYLKKKNSRFYLYSQREDFYRYREYFDLKKLKMKSIVLGNI